jgi:hypothetical protein
VVVAGGWVVSGAPFPPASGTVVVADTTVVAGVGSTIVAGAVVVAGTVVAGTVMVAGTVVAGTVMVAGTVVTGPVADPPEVAVTVGRIVVVGGGAGRVNNSTRSP